MAVCDAKRRVSIAGAHPTVGDTETRSQPGTEANAFEALPEPGFVIISSRMEL